MPGAISTKLGTHMTYSPENNTVGVMYPQHTYEQGWEGMRSKNNGGNVPLAHL